MVSKQLSKRLGILFGALYSVAVLFFLYHLFLSHFELARDERLAFFQKTEQSSVVKDSSPFHQEIFNKETLPAYLKEYVGQSQNFIFNIEGIALKDQRFFGVLELKNNTSWVWKYQNHTELINAVFVRFLKTSGLYLFGMAALGFAMMLMIHRSSIAKVNQIIAEEEEKDRKSNFDPLTGLKNRLQILRDLSLMIDQLHDTKEKFALIVFDVDDMDLVNEKYGKDRGDKVLSYLAKRVRNSLNKKDEFARTGGDEFFILLKSFQGYQHASMTADRVINVIQSAFNVDNESINITLSAGVSFFPQDAKESEELIEAATTALQYAKKDGKNCFRTFDTKINRLVQKKVQIEHRLKLALSRNEFAMVYQGVHDADSTVVGSEAFLRWHLDGEVLEPHKFLPMAANGHLIISIGYWVFEEVFKQMSGWRQQGLILLPMYINLSGAQILDEHIFSILEVLMIRYKIPPHLIRLDIKEIELYEKRMHSFQAIQKLSKLGLKIWIDDMGTGYSSFNALANLPFEGVKIDGFLTHDLLVEDKARNTIQTIMSLAKSQNWILLAESVETQDQASWYMTKNAALFQGRFYSHPVEASEFSKSLLRDSNSIH